jgi:hypothetical protein
LPAAVVNVCDSTWQLLHCSNQKVFPRPASDFFQRMIISHPLERQMGCMDLICGGVLERYPRLRMAFLEAGGLWVPYWLARLDEFYGKIAHLVPKLKMKPSEYFRRQCFCSAEPDDISLKVAASLNADDFLMWASDYPHYDCTFPGAVEELREHGAALPESAQRKIMGENAARCYWTLIAECSTATRGPSSRRSPGPEGSRINRE